MRYIFALLLLLSTVTPQPQQQNPRHGKSGARSNPPSPSAPSFVVGQQDFGAKEQQPEPKQETPYWKKLIEPSVLSNLLLAGVAIWAGCIALRTLAAIREQTRETARSAGAAEKSALASENSVRLQEASIRQYVEFEDFEILSDTCWPNTTSLELRLTFDITNPTNLLLTLTRVAVDFGGKTTEATMREALAHDVGYHVKREIDIKGERLELFKKGELVMPLIVWAGFEDAFGVFREQSDGSNCVCSQSGCEFEAYEGVIGERWINQQNSEDGA